MTLPTAAIAAPPADVISSTTDAASDASRSFTVTSPPSAARPSAVARPIPLPAPVTMATVPSNRGAVAASGHISASPPGSVPNTLMSTIVPMPPMLWVMPSRAPSTWRSPASPRSCSHSSTTCATPVAPIGWPFAFSPPLVLTGTSPPSIGPPDSSHFPAAPALAEAEVLVGDELGDREAVVHLGEVDVLGSDAGHRERLPRRLDGGREGREGPLPAADQRVGRQPGAPQVDRLVGELRRQVGASEQHGGGAVGGGAAVEQAERPRDERAR